MLGEWPLLGREERARVSIEGASSLAVYLIAFLLDGIEHSGANDARGVNP